MLIKYVQIKWYEKKKNRRLPTMKKLEKGRRYSYLLSLAMMQGQKVRPMRNKLTTNSLLTIMPCEVSTYNN